MSAGAGVVAGWVYESVSLVWFRSMGWSGTVVSRVELNAAPSDAAGDGGVESAGSVGEGQLSAADEAAAVMAGWLSEPERPFVAGIKLVVDAYQKDRADPDFAGPGI